MNPIYKPGRRAPKSASRAKGAAQKYSHSHVGIRSSECLAAAPHRARAGTRPSKMW